MLAGAPAAADRIWESGIDLTPVRLGFQSASAVQDNVGFASPGTDFPDRTSRKTSRTGGGELRKSGSFSAGGANYSLEALYISTQAKLRMELVKDGAFLASAPAESDPEYHWRVVASYDGGEATYWLNELTAGKQDTVDAWAWPAESGHVWQDADVVDVRIYSGLTRVWDARIRPAGTAADGGDGSGDTGYYEGVGAGPTNPGFAGASLDEPHFGATAEFRVFMLYIETTASLNFGIVSDPAVAAWPAGRLRIGTLEDDFVVAVPANDVPLAASVDGEAARAWTWSFPLETRTGIDGQWWKPKERFRVRYDAPTGVAGVALSGTPVEEDATGAQTVTVTATLNGAPVAAATVVTATVGAAGDAAVAGTDYVAVTSPVTVTVARGAASGEATFELEPIDDDEWEPREAITLAGPAAGLIGSASGTAAIEYSDGMAVWDATLTAEDDDSGDSNARGYNAIDYSDVDPYGDLEPDTFGCCVWWDAGGAEEIEYTVEYLVVSGTPGFLAFRTAPETSPLFTALRIQARNYPVLHADGVGVPGDFTEGDDAYYWLGADEDDFSDGADYAVQFLGPPHPRIEEVAFVSTATAMSGSDTVYGVGERIRVQVTYTEPVAVTGAPHFVLQVGSNDRNATYLEGSGTDTLEFAYTVVAADMDDADGVTFERDTSTDSGVQSPIVVDTGEQIEAVAQRTYPWASDYIPKAFAAESTDEGVDGSQTPPKPALTVADATVDENAGPARLTVTLAYAAAADVTFEYATASVTASAGHDYTSVSAGSATIAAGDTMTTLEIAILDDFEDEAAEETFTVTLSNPSSNALLGAAKTATVTIRDDEVPTVSIAAPVAAVGGYLFENEATDTGNGAWALRRAGYIGEALEVSVDVSETGTGSSTFLGTAPRTATFQTSSETASFNPIVDDTNPESHGTVTVTLQDGAGYDVAASPHDSAEVAVRDDDGRLIQASLDPDRLSVAEGRKARVEAVFTAVRAGTFTAQGDFERVFGTQSFVDAFAVATSAIDATITADFVAISELGTLDFTDFMRAGGTGAWEARYPYETDVEEDDTADADERFVISLASVSLPMTVVGTSYTIAGYSATALAAAEVTITEGIPLTLVLSDDSLAEGDDAAGAERTTVTATLAEAVDTAFAVAVSTDPAGSDRFEFVGANRTLSFAANATQSTGAVTLRAVANDVDDGDLEVTVTGTPDAVGMGKDVLAGEATLTVVDDDLPTVSLAIPAAATPLPSPGSGVTDHYLFENEASDTGDGAWTVTRAGLTDAALEVEVKRCRGDRPRPSATSWRRRTRAP